jgi:hypothetical protein
MAADSQDLEQVLAVAWALVLAEVWEEEWAQATAGALAEE